MTEYFKPGDKVVIGEAIKNHPYGSKNWTVGKVYVVIGNPVVSQPFVYSDVPSGSNLVGYLLAQKSPTQDGRHWFLPAAKPKRKIFA